MKKNLLLAGLFFLLLSGAASAQPNPSATPSVQVVVTGEDNPVTRAQVTRNNRNSNNGTDLRGFLTFEQRQSFLQRMVAPFYRKPTKDELKLVAPDAELLEKYAAFLEQEDTGIFKLLVDEGCAERTTVVVATENCLKYRFPGAGNSFSFRTKSYRLRRLADLTFSNKALFAPGVLTHGIMVNIGDVPLENVSFETPGLKFIKEFQPVIEFEKARAVSKQLLNGIKKDGFVYSRAFLAAENTTYVLRSIAYDGRVMRAIGGIAYNELDFDKRKDITVAFRIVGQDANGSVTILWKELSRKDSPKFKKLTEEEIKRIKENKFLGQNLLKNESGK